jgi:hypothetical protein
MEVAKRNNMYTDCCVEKANVELRGGKGKRPWLKARLTKNLAIAKTAIPLLPTQAIGSLLSVESE